MGLFLCAHGGIELPEKTSLSSLISSNHLPLFNQSGGRGDVRGYHARSGRGGCAGTHLRRWAHLDQKVRTRIAALSYLMLFWGVLEISVLLSPVWPRFILSAPKHAHQRPSFCAGPTTSCVTRWSAHCTTLSAWSRGCWSPSVSFQVGALWRPLCQSTWRIMPPAWWDECLCSCWELWVFGQTLQSYYFYFFFKGSREQLAIAEFARSLLVIPKTLAVNAAQDSTDLVAKLRAFHNEAQVNPERKNLKWWASSSLKDLRIKTEGNYIRGTFKLRSKIYS